MRHKVEQEIYRGGDENQLLDPGSGGTIRVDRSPCYCGLVSAAAEARTLARPETVGAILILEMKTDGGDITLTVTGGINIASSTGYTFTDAGQTAIFVSALVGTAYVWRLVSSSAQMVPAETLITTRTLRADDSGKVFFLALVGGFTVTLPAPLLGLNFKFIVAIAPTTAYIITTNAGANILYGMFEERAGGAGVAGAIQDTQNFVASQAIIADWAYYYSDGTNWYVHGMVNVAAGVTFAVT